MNNYVYIISSIPELLKSWSFGRDFSADAIISDIKSQCSDSDNALIDCILDGFDGDKLNEGFYLEMLKSPNHFIREYFRFDLKMRNAKVRYLNKALKRDPVQDMIFLEDEDNEFDELPAVNKILEGDDILAREKGLDDTMWEKIENLTSFNLFDMDIILSTVVKLKIIDRWLKLDENTGRKYFQELTDTMISSYEGLEYNEK